MYNLTEEDKVLLMCAFEVANIDCPGCINLDKCDKSFYDMGQELLIKMGIIKEKSWNGIEKDRKQ